MYSFLRSGEAIPEELWCLLGSAKSLVITRDEKKEGPASDSETQWYIYRWLFDHLSVSNEMSRLITRIFCLLLLHMRLHVVVDVKSRCEMLSKKYALLGLDGIALLATDDFSHFIIFVSSEKKESEKGHHWCTRMNFLTLSGLSTLTASRNTRQRPERYEALYECIVSFSFFYRADHAF